MKLFRHRGAPNDSDAFTINSQPDDLYPCSKPSQRLLKLILDF